VPYDIPEDVQPISPGIVDITKGMWGSELGPLNDNPETRS